MLTPRLIIEILTSSLAGKRFVYETPELKFGVKIGRAPDCDIRFDANRDLKVSSHHASIDEREDGIDVADAGSSNGLYLNDERVASEGSKLYDGDEISFGQAGATARISLPGDNSTRPTVRIDLEKVDDAETKNIRDDSNDGELTVMVNKAGDAAGAGEKTRAMMKAVAGAMSESSERKRANLASKFALVFIIAAVGVGVLIWQLQMTHQKNRDVEKARIDKLRADDEKLAARFDASEKKFQTYADEERKRRVNMRNLQVEEIKQLQDQLGEEVASRLADIQKEQEVAFDAALQASAKGQNKKFEDALEARNKEVDRLIAEAKNKGLEVKETPAEAFKKITANYNESVFLIYVQYPLLDKNGKQVGIEAGTGTGWLAKTSDKKAWVVTNKHVMHPYMFKPELVVSHAIRNVHVAPYEDWLISVWQPGTRLRPKIGDDRISVNESWANLPDVGGSQGGGRGRVTIKGRAADDMVTVGENYKYYLKKAGFPESLPNEVLKRVKAAKFHVLNTDKDLAILELERLDKKYLSKPIPMASNFELKKLAQLDPVLALGYPLGLSVIKGTTVTTSPVLGVIRSTQWDVSVIGHSAPILPGNSGGPLINADGKVIGVTTRRYEGTISEAISISHARALVKLYAK
ncbi:MAG: trypsin-like peptidase domain-containing protein [Planctomycetes bacterium]|nr:trypsin-like peptidase domain-containing protein [Planctomycetota bacterium]